MAKTITHPAAIAEHLVALASSSYICDRLTGGYVIADGISVDPDLIVYLILLTLVVLPGAFYAWRKMTAKQRPHYQQQQQLQQQREEEQEQQLR